MNLYCPKCKEIRCKSIGKGASIKINDKPIDSSMIKDIIKCGECGSSLVTEEELNSK